MVFLRSCSSSLSRHEEENPVPLPAELTFLVKETTAEMPESTQGMFPFQCRTDTHLHICLMHSRPNSVSFSQTQPKFVHHIMMLIACTNAKHKDCTFLGPRTSAAGTSARKALAFKDSGEDGKNVNSFHFVNS